MQRLSQPQARAPEAEILQQLRDKREEVCFPVINRGLLWYESLTAEQRKELKQWYKAWLDVTETKQEPQLPLWLFNSSNTIDKTEGENGANTN